MQNTANGHDCRADYDGLFATETLTEVECPDGAEEGADVVDCCNGGEEAAGWAKLEGVEVVIGDIDAAEDTLVAGES